MRNMVGYVIVAHKNDMDGNFYWNRKVIQINDNIVGHIKIFNKI
jgi:hypothetical protein